MKKILIISSNRLGDSILTSGLINYYRSKYKNTKITFACGELPSFLFKYCNKIEKVIVVKKLKFSLHWFLLWRKVALEFWDIILDLRGTGLSYFLLSKKRVINPLNNKKYKEKKVHKVALLSKFFGKKLISPNLDLNYNVEKEEILKKYVSCYKNIIAIAPGANWKAKQWPKEHFLLLLKNLQSNHNFKNHNFILLGSKNESEAGNFIKLNLKKKNIVNLIGLPSLIEIYFLLKECKLFIGNDSGLMHLAAVCGIPTIGLFGPSNKYQYHPWGEKILALSTPETPESLMNKENFSHKNTANLMKTLTVKVVTLNTINFFKKYK